MLFFFFFFSSIRRHTRCSRDWSSDVCSSDLDLAANCAGQIAATLDEIRRLFPQLVELYDNTASLQDRTASTGVLRGELARQFGAGGYVGRASGRAFDARKTPG